MILSAASLTRPNVTPYSICPLLSACLPTLVRIPSYEFLIVSARPQTIKWFDRGCVISCRLLLRNEPDGSTSKIAFWDVWMHTIADFLGERYDGSESQPVWVMHRNHTLIIQAATPCHGIFTNRLPFLRYQEVKMCSCDAWLCQVHVEPGRPHIR